MKRVRRNEQDGLAVATFLDGKGWLKKPDVLDGTGLTSSQFKDGLMWFRQYGGVVLGYTIVCDKRNDTYALCDEFGHPVDGASLVGYDVHLAKDRATRAMTGYSVALTGYRRAQINDATLEVATYRKRVRGFRNVLESFAEEADRIGDTKEQNRIEAFLTANPM